MAKVVIKMVPTNLKAPSNVDIKLTVNGEELEDVIVLGVEPDLSSIGIKENRVLVIFSVIESTPQVDHD